MKNKWIICLCWLLLCGYTSENTDIILDRGCHELWTRADSYGFYSYSLTQSTDEKVVLTIGKTTREITLLKDAQIVFLASHESIPDYLFKTNFKLLEAIIALQKMSGAR